MARFNEQSKVPNLPDQEGVRHFGDGIAGAITAARLQGYDSSTLAYVDVAVDSSGQVKTLGGGTGGGGAVTVADGADVAEGATTDLVWVSGGNGSLIAISKYQAQKLEAIRALLAGTLTVNVGLTDAQLRASAVAISAAALPLPAGAATEATLSAMSAKLPASLGQKTMAASEAVVIASDQSAVPTKETPSTLVGTAISAANAAVTLTLGAAGAGLFHYVTSIEIVALNPTITAIAAAATNLAYTSTNLGGIAWNSGTLLAAGAEKLIARLAFAQPLKSTVANTASTIVAPAIGAGGLVRITVTYYTAT